MLLNGTSPSIFTVAAFAASGVIVLQGPEQVDVHGVRSFRVVLPGMETEKLALRQPELQVVTCRQSGLLVQLNEITEPEGAVLSQEAFR